MIVRHARRVARQSLLVADLACAFLQYKQSMLAQHNNVVLLQVLIEVDDDLSCLFSDVANPLRFDVDFLIIAVFFISLHLLLLFDVTR